ncbi:hypothetical protein ACE10Z_36530 [Bradyrhizobium sp. Pha-3]|uniref:hypothetical protein n=1 Tax=Bradyrhizobium sp. Pha-3 TaxID=208375 RepID=UPI0035D4E0CD
MNTDLRNTAEDSNESYDLLQQAQRQPGDLSSQASSPAHPSADQANFDQKLSELRPIQPTAAASTDSEIGSRSTMTKGNLRARAIPQTERCPAPSFVRGRAELAASLSGANVEALRNEIRLAEQRSAQWPGTNRSCAGSVDSSSVFNNVLASSYLQLHRFQDAASDCDPRLDDNVSAIAHVRSLADLRCHENPHVSEAFRWEDDEEDEKKEDEIDKARLAAMHTQGDIDSAFVSLSQDPSQLLVSRDDSEYGAKAIAENAKELHTYMVPRVSAWPAKKINDILERGHAPGDRELRDWVRGLPTEETEVLFLGGNLADYRIASELNPHRADAPQSARPIKKARVTPDSP